MFPVDTDRFNCNLQTQLFISVELLTNIFIELNNDSRVLFFKISISGLLLPNILRYEFNLTFQDFRPVPRPQGLLQYLTERSVIGPHTVNKRITPRGIAQWGHGAPVPRLNWHVTLSRWSPPAEHVLFGVPRAPMSARIRTFRPALSAGKSETAVRVCFAG